MKHHFNPSLVDKYALGVDGGGTKTEVWLARFDGGGEPTVLGRGRAGSSNARAVGMESALANLGAAINAAWADAKLEPVAVDCAVLALSGAGHAAVREQFAAWADDRKLARLVRFEHDAEPVLVAGTPEGWGVALIVGTGSAAVGVNRQGERKIVGGWGYHYGDEGSAYWIGRRALEAVARAADGRAAPTRLTVAIVSRLQVDSPRSMLGALEQTGNVRGAIAGLANTVEGVAREGDAAAIRIVDEAAEELATMIATLAKQLQLGDSFPLALAGGAICGSELLRSRLRSALDAHDLKPTTVTMVPHPVGGCLLIARRAMQTT
jgi:N-acetylglucosamine kinase-like BadF-type ATPase